MADLNVKIEQLDADRAGPTAFKRTRTAAMANGELLAEGEVLEGLSLARTPSAGYGDDRSCKPRPYSAGRGP